jgi:signal transduction histidine kinase
MQRMRAFFFTAAPRRVLIEMVALYVVCVSIIFLVPNVSSDTQGIAEDSLSSLALLSAALRLRLCTGRWWRQLGYEGATAFALSSALAILFLIVVLVTNPNWFANPDITRPDPRTPGGFASVLFTHFQGYFFTRLLILMLRFLNRQRHVHLQWSMTYAIVLTMALTVFLCGGLSAIILVANASFDPAGGFPISNSIAGWSATALVIVSLLIALAITVFIVMLIPAILLSSYFTRHTTLRLKRLATTASALQAGDLSVRVTVEGGDEVAQLQITFNAMATDLQRTMGDLAQTNHALEAERDAVERLLQERRVLIAGVSHELRTPVATLRGYLDSTLEHWNDAPPPTLRTDLEVMERETIRLQRLLDDLFTLSRAEVGQLPLTLAPTDLGVTLRRSIEAAAPSAWESGKVELIADIPANLPCALVDEGRLEQIVRNLLRNAIRHTPPGGVVVLSAAAEPDAIIVQVKDTGEGIAPADLPHIFERFYRATSARERDSSGAGIGLALVKELAEAMGGSVTAASAPGQGACVSVRLRQG